MADTSELYIDRLPFGIDTNKLIKDDMKGMLAVVITPNRNQFPPLQVFPVRPKEFPFPGLFSFKDSYSNPSFRSGTL